MNELKCGRLFFIKDEFFKEVEDIYLKFNYSQTQRPHYYAFTDKDTGLCWAIPCSKEIEKYEDIIQRKIKNNQPHNHIQIIKVAGIKQAFLYQDMFPLLPCYIKNIYKNRYGYMEIQNPKLIQSIEENSYRIIKLIKHDVKFTPTQPDALRIEKIMLEKLR